jgi:hypothetical protein
VPPQGAYGHHLRTQPAGHALEVVAAILDLYFARAHLGEPVRTDRAGSPALAFDLDSPGRSMAGTLPMAFAITAWCTKSTPLGKVVVAT